MEEISESIEEVISEYSHMVYRLAFARAKNKYDAEEIFQEVFLRYVKKKPKFNNKEHQKAWILKVACNCSQKIINSAWNRRTVPLDENIEFEDIKNGELYYELKKLPEKYRTVIHLFYYEDMSVEEIARLLHMKKSTVRTQLTRGRAMLRNIVKEEDYV